MKRLLLCAECEALFNSFETPFASNVFHPFANKDVPFAKYDAWMAKFCASISWRVLVFMREVGAFEDLPEKELVDIERALSTWKAFLFDDIANPRECELHILPCGEIEETDIPNMPNNYNRYMARVVDVDFAYTSDLAFTYAKLGPIMLFGFIRKPSFKWEGTRVKIKGGVFGKGRYTLPENVLKYFFYRCEQAQKVTEQISEAQWEKIDRLVHNNIERARNSLQVLAMQRDAEMFGQSAVVRRPKR